MVIPETLIDFISRHEGFSPMPYVCPAGHLTVGRGHNLDVPMRENAANALLVEDIKDATRDLIVVLPDLYSYSEARGNALIDMAFNLGITRFKGFKKMIAAIKRGDWELAAKEAECSTWYQQVGGRGVEVVKMLKEG